MGNFRRISKKYYVRQFVTCMLVYIMLLGMPVQVALAYIGDGGGGIPVAGDATITAPGGTNNALIDMITERAVINWQDFDTDVGQLAEFIKSSGGNFAVLNRVIGGNQTSFLGDLKALNGDVFVINTRGIVFGPDSYIQARNFVASGIDMSNNDFMVPDGQFAFQRNSSGYANDELIGNITNNGIDTGHGIHADQVALIGRNVTNKGLISAPGGAVVMAAGEAVYLNQFGSNVSVEVSQGYTSPYEHVVDNGGDEGWGMGTGPGTIEATGGKVILAAGDIYSTAIEGVESLRAEATGDITLNGAIGASGHVEILGGQNRIISKNADIYINDDITAGSMRIKNGKDEYPGEESLSGIYVADGKNLTATAGNVVVEAVHDVVLGGDVEATYGDVFINGDEDGYGNPKGDPEGYHPKPYGGGDVIANNITAGGNIDIKGNAIQLNGYVSANGGDLTITGRTSKDNYTYFTERDGDDLGVEWGYIDAAAGINLQAGGNVVLTDAFGSGGDEEPPAGEMDLFGHGLLGIIADGGSIQTQGPFGKGVKITVENLSPAFLGMLQADPLNLADYSFGNQNNTDLYLQSLDGSVTAVDSSQTLSGKDDNAADQWTSITAQAYDDITLQGHDASRDITAGELTSYAADFDTGNITVTSDNRKVLVTEDVIAYQGSISLTAIDPDNGGIESGGDILATDGITLFGEVTANGGEGSQIFDAGQGTLWAKDTLSTITKTTAGGLVLGGDTLVNLDGIEDSVWVQDGFLTITDSVDVEGNLKAKGVIHLQGTTNNVAGDILSTGSGIIIDHDLDADGVGSQTFDAGTGQLWAKNEADIDKITAGSLTLAGDTGIVLGGNVTGTGMTSVDKLIFKNNVTANGTGNAVDQRFDAGLGALDADGSIAKTTDGKLNLGGDVGIELGGNVETHDGDLTFEDAVTADGTGAQSFDAGTAWHSWGNDLVAADDIIKTTDGSLTLDGGRGDTESEIYLAGNVETHNGDLIFKDKVVANGVGDQSLDAGNTYHSWGNDLVAEQDITKTTAGSLTLDGGRGDTDSEIYLAGNVVTTDGDLTFEDKVIADGSGNQRFDAVGCKLWATDTITKTNAGSGDLNLGGDDAIDLDGTVDVQTTDGSLIIEDSFTAAGDLLANDDIKVGSCSGTTGTWANGEFDGVGNQQMYADGGVIKVNSSEMISGDDVEPYLKKTTPGNLKIDAGSDITMRANVTVDNGSLDILAGGTAGLYGNLKSTGDMTLNSSGRLRLHGNADSTGGSVAMTGGGDGIWMYWESWGRNVKAAGDILLNSDTHVLYTAAPGEYQFDAGGDVYLKNGKDLASSNNASLHVKAGDDIILGAFDQYNPDAGGSAGNVFAGGDLTLTAGDDVYAHGVVESDGILDVDADNDIRLKANVSSVGVMTMDAGSDIELNRSSGNTSSESTIALNAGDSVTIGKVFSGEGNVTANGNMDIIAGTDSGDNVKVLGKLTTTNGGNINVEAGGDIKLYGSFSGPEFESAQADGDLTLDAGYDIDVLGDLISNNGSIELSSDVGTTYLGGNVTAAIDVTLNNNTEFDDDDDQKVDAKAGTITAKGWLWKASDWGSLYLEAAGDISLADEVVADWGGVSIISENGKIFTPDGCGYETDTLNVYVYGWSDDYFGDGVDLLYGPGKAAIIIASAENLNIGPDAELVAEGVYDDTGTVDDRQGVDFLADPLISIGGIIRDEGDPFDVAIYLASTEGDVDVSSPVSITSCEPMVQSVSVESENGRYECVPKGAMVIDAWNAVTFDGGVPGGMFETSLANGVVGDRLEVVSRISEWLFEAVGRLPYVYGGGTFPSDYSYVLRGAGRDNPLITDGRAWVLVDPVDPAPLYQEAGEASDKEEFGEGGCPPLMNWLANEIGVPSEDIQVVVAGALALNTDIQPCEMCARLLDAATTLEDAEGTQIAAMARVVNEFVTTPAPPSPEQMTQIAAALALHVGDGTHYAATGQWIDALEAYVGIMNTEMGYSASDASAFAEKYLTPVTDLGNATLTAYVTARLAALGG